MAGWFVKGSSNTLTFWKNQWKSIDAAACRVALGHHVVIWGRTWQAQAVNTQKPFHRAVVMLFYLMLVCIHAPQLVASKSSTAVGVKGKASLLA